MHQIIVFLILGLCAIAKAEFRDCGSTIGSFSRVSVSDCDFDGTVYTCESGKYMIIHVDFTINRPVESVTADSTGTHGGVTIPFIQNDQNACDDIDIRCPLTDTTEIYHYQDTRRIGKEFANLSMDIHLRLRNEKNEKIVCVAFPVKIV